MSVSFIYQNLSFFYRIDSHSSSMPFIAWGCRQIPISGNSPSKEAMYSDIEKTLRQYYRNRVPVPKELLMSEASNSERSKATKTCDDWGLTNDKLESQDACPDCLTDPYNYK